MGSKLIQMQPILIHVPTMKDVVYTPRWLSKAIIDYFQPSGLCLDPCVGAGAFYDYLPEASRIGARYRKGATFFSTSI